MRIRAAADHDAQAIGQVHVEVWRFAYRDILPEGYLASLSPEERAVQWRSLLKDPQSARFVLIAVNERDEVLGFAAAGPERSGEPRNQGELYALYVLPSHQRRGLGHELVRAVAHRLLANGMSSMLLWVLESNASARRFYERLGGAMVRHQPTDIGGVTLTEVAYGWPRLGLLLKTSAAEPSA